MFKYLSYFSFIDYQKLLNDDFDLQKIKLELLEKWKETRFQEINKRTEKTRLFKKDFFYRDFFSIKNLLINELIYKTTSSELLSNIYRKKDLFSKSRWINTYFI